MGLTTPNRNGEQMSWVGPVAKGGAKYVVKYGPQAKILWENGGKQVQAAARDKAEAAMARRTAFQKAETVVDGSVLKQIDAGKPVWVVYAADEPIDAFPKPSVPLAELVSHGDLDARMTTAAHRDHQLRARARRARSRMPQRKRHPNALGRGEERT